MTDPPSTSPVKLECKPTEGVVTVGLPGETPEELRPEQARFLAQHLQATKTEEMARDDTELSGLVADLEVAADEIDHYQQE